MNKEIIIFGAGHKGKHLRRMLMSEHIHIDDNKYEVKYFCDNNIPGGYVDGIPVLNPRNLKTIIDETDYPVVISSEHIIDEVITQLHSQGMDDKQIYYVPPYVFEYKWNDSVGMPFFVRIDVSKPRIPYVEVEVTSGCNLKCKGCYTFSNINKNTNVEPEIVEQDLHQLKKYFSGVRYLKFLGGETLLHPRLGDLLELARRLFPDAEFEVHSNGLLVPTMDEIVLDKMRQLDCHFIFTLYPPTGRVKRSIELRLQQNDVAYRFTEPVWEFARSINIRGDYDPDEIFAHCYRCIILKNGILSCGLEEVISKVEKNFNIKIFDGEFDNQINIYKTNLTGWEVNEKLARPSIVCRYCVFFKKTYAPKDDLSYPWTNQGEPKVEDWVVGS